jgi:hypothetical protein
LVLERIKSSKLRLILNQPEHLAQHKPRLGYAFEIAMTIDDRSGPDRFTPLLLKPVGADDNSHDCVAFRSVTKSTSPVPRGAVDAATGFVKVTRSLK